MVEERGKLCCDVDLLGVERRKGGREGVGERERERGGGEGEKEAFDSLTNMYI